MLSETIITYFNRKSDLSLSIYIYVFFLDFSYSPAGKELFLVRRPSLKPIGFYQLVKAKKQPAPLCSSDSLKLLLPHDFSVNVMSLWVHSTFLLCLSVPMNKGSVEVMM